MRVGTRWVAVTALLVSVACGGGGPAGDDDDATPSVGGSPLGSGPPATGGAQCPPAEANDHGAVDRTGRARVEMSIELDDNYFEPTCIEIDAGTTLNLEIENEGTRQHTFTSPELDVDETVAPGSKQEITFDVGGGGVVRFLCKFHSGTGMVGAFDVQG